jgi:hypothetical protein
MTRMLRPGFDQTVLSPALGVMFRDGVDDRVVSDGLRVSLEDPQQPLLPPQPLTANGYGVFVAHQVPRLRTWMASSPMDTRRYTLKLEDPLGRFLPMTIPADLPSDGLLEPACMGTSPGAAVPSVPLYSAAARTVPVGHAEVRVDLRLASEPDVAAAWARLELWLDDTGQLLAEGLADERGCALLVCAQPALRDPPLRASPPDAQAPLGNWNVSLRAFWNPAIARAEVPDLCALHALPEVQLLQGTAPPRPLAPALLAAGSPLVIRSDGSSFVFVGA